MKAEYTAKDIYHFLVLYFFAIVTVYLLPNLVAYAYFACLIVAFWNSKKNAFWFVLIFFLVDPPGDFFPSDYNYGLPFIYGVNLRFQEVFTYVAFLKVLKSKNKFYSVYKREFMILLAVMAILFVYTFLLEHSVRSVIVSLKWVFVWSLIFSVPSLINRISEWIFFFRMCFIISFIALGFQLLYLMLGHPPAYLLGTNFSPMMNYGDYALLELDISNYSETEARPISCSYIVLTAFIGSMFFLQMKKNPFRKTYLYLVMLVCFISIFLTATRGWFIGFSLVLIIYLLKFNLIGNLLKTGAIIILLLPVLFKLNVFEKQVEGSFKRLLSIESVVKGDISAKGSNSRGDYSIQLIKLWKESPVFGFGFTDYFKANGNGHAGHANLLFHVGILGILAFIIFWYKLYTLPFKIDKLLSQQNPYKGAIITLNYYFIILFVLHSTSGQQFGFYINIGMGIFVQAFIYSFSSFFINEALKEERQISLSTDNAFEKAYS